MSSRADRVSPIQQRILYSDFMNNLDKNPVTGFLARVTNEESIKQAIRNLVMTDIGERPYQPNLGSKIRSLLFEPMDDVTQELIRTTLRDTLNQDPRVNVINISVAGNYDLNSYLIDIVFSVINIPEQINLNIILRRVR